VEGGPSAPWTAAAGGVTATPPLAWPTVSIARAGLSFFEGTDCGCPIDGTGADSIDTRSSAAISASGSDRRPLEMGGSSSSKLTSSPSGSVGASARIGGRSLMSTVVDGAGLSADTSSAGGSSAAGLTETLGGVGAIGPGVGAT